MCQRAVRLGPNAKGSGRANAFGFDPETRHSSARSARWPRAMSGRKEAQALEAIALQVRQSLWRSRSSDPLDHHGARINRTEKKMIWKSIVRPGTTAPASAHWSTMSGYARKTAETVSDFASIVHNLVMDVRDSYRPELHYMRGPGPKWRARHQPWPGFDSEAVLPTGQHQLSPVHIRRPDTANPIR
jgi:hypothetical protein